MARGDIAAVLIGAELGAALGLLVVGGITLAPIGVTLVGAALGPAALRAWRPLRLVLFRRWLRTRLRENALPPT